MNAVMNPAQPPTAAPVETPPAAPARHTPGPWVWHGRTLAPLNRDPEASAVHSILDAEGGYGFLGSKPTETLTELDADFLLIATAPDLLAACQSARAVIARERADYASSNAWHAVPAGEDPAKFVRLGEELFTLGDATLLRDYDRTLTQLKNAIAAATGATA